MSRCFVCILKEFVDEKVTQVNKQSFYFFYKNVGKLILYNCKSRAERKTYICKYSGERKGVFKKLYFSQEEGES